ncbi:MAG: type II toxin-antitoxin system Phd/YefM family antitoxin [Synergistaceae bacterium]|nr:type II toxin-antitoxin system Phd/YefM family antitoxin [Synergistaceae bacterium]
MKHLTASTARKNFDAVLGDVTRFREPVAIVSDDNDAAVIISMDEWNSIQETLYLCSIPGMVESIKAAASEPLEYGVPAEEVDFGV